MTAFPRITSRLWYLYLCLALAGTLVYFVVPPIARSGLVFNVLGISAVIAILVGVRVHRPAHPLPWILFALAQGFFVAGMSSTTRCRAS
jgi:hypothetical protein